MAADGALARALPARRKVEKARRLALVPPGRRAQSSGLAAIVDFAIIFFIGGAYILLSHGTWPESADWLNIHGFFFHQWLVIAIYASLFVACADYYRLYR